MTSPTSPKLQDLLHPFESLRTGQSLDTESQYRLGVELAQGANGDVFAAVKVSQGSFTQVAAKRIRVQGATNRKAALNEVETAYLCRNAGNHPNVIHFLEFFPGRDGIEREIYFMKRVILLGDRF